MWRVVKKKIADRKGFTLTEMVVVMGILAIMLTMVFSGFLVSRKDNYFKYVANNFQINLRQAFVDVVSTKVNSGGNCDTHASVIKLIQIKLGTSVDLSDATLPYGVKTFCEAGGALTADYAGIDPSIDVNYKQNIKITGGFSGGSPSSTTGTYTFFYTSPYGKFYFTPNAAWSNTICWKKDSDQTYVPDTTACSGAGYGNIPSQNFGDVSIAFDDPSGTSSTNVHQVIVTPQGNPEVK